MTSLLDLSRQQKREAKTMILAHQHLAMTGNPRREIAARAIHLKVNQEETRWQIGMGHISNTWAQHMLAVSDQAIAYAQMHWKVEKANEPPPVPPDDAEVRMLITALLVEEQMTTGALTTYLQLALATSEVSGQAALIKMGLNRTFAWAHPQAMARDLFQVRGSKIVQNMYGSHIDQLTKMIIDATDPRNPHTIAEVKSGIQREWPQLRGYQVERIARTETATIWADTQLNAYAANGIQMINSILATGPSIPGSPDYSPQATIQAAEPCDECADYAANGPYAVDDVDIPLHPNCRCEVIPVLQDEEGNPWLPPDQPFTGEAISGLDASAVPGEGDVQAAYTPNVFRYPEVVRLPGVRRHRKTV